MYMFTSYAFRFVWFFLCFPFFPFFFFFFYLSFLSFHSIFFFSFSQFHKDLLVPTSMCIWFIYLSIQFSFSCILKLWSVRNNMVLDTDELFSTCEWVWVWVWVCVCMDIRPSVEFRFLWHSGILNSSFGV